MNNTGGTGGTGSAGGAAGVAGEQSEKKETPHIDASTSKSADDDAEKKHKEFFSSQELEDIFKIRLRRDKEIRLPDIMTVPDSNSTLKSRVGSFIVLTSSELQEVLQTNEVQPHFRGFVQSDAIPYWVDEDKKELVESPTSASTKYYLMKKIQLNHQPTQALAMTEEKFRSCMDDLLRQELPSIDQVQLKTTADIVLTLQNEFVDRVCALLCATKEYTRSLLETDRYERIINDFKAESSESSALPASKPAASKTHNNSVNLPIDKTMDAAAESFVPSPDADARGSTVSVSKPTETDADVGALTETVALSKSAALPDAVPQKSTDADAAASISAAHLSDDNAAASQKFEFVGLDERPFFPTEPQVFPDRKEVMREIRELDSDIAIVVTATKDLDSMLLCIYPYTEGWTLADKIKEFGEDPQSESPVKKSMDRLNQWWRNPLVHNRTLKNFEELNTTRSTYIALFELAACHLSLEWKHQQNMDVLESDLKSLRDRNQFLLDQLDSLSSGNNSDTGPQQPPHQPRERDNLQRYQPSPHSYGHTAADILGYGPPPAQGWDSPVEQGHHSHDDRHGHRSYYSPFAAGGGGEGYRGARGGPSSSSHGPPPRGRGRGQLHWGARGSPGNGRFSLQQSQAMHSSFGTTSAFGTSSNFAASNTNSNNAAGGFGNVNNNAAAPPAFAAAAASTSSVPNPFVAAPQETTTTAAAAVAAPMSFGVSPNVATGSTSASAFSNHNNMMTNSAAGRGSMSPATTTPYSGGGGGGGGSSSSASPFGSPMQQHSDHEDMTGSGNSSENKNKKPLSKLPFGTPVATTSTSTTPTSSWPAAPSLFAGSSNLSPIPESSSAAPNINDYDNTMLPGAASPSPVPNDNNSNSAAAPEKDKRLSNLKAEIEQKKKRLEEKQQKKLAAAPKASSSSSTSPTPFATSAGLNPDAPSFSRKTSSGGGGGKGGRGGGAVKRSPPSGVENNNNKKQRGS